MQHLLDEDAAQDLPRRRPACAGPAQRVVGGQIRRDGRVLELDRLLQRKLQAREVGDLGRLDLQHDRSPTSRRAGMRRPTWFAASLRSCCQGWPAGRARRRPVAPRAWPSARVGRYHGPRFQRYRPGDDLLHPFLQNAAPARRQVAGHRHVVGMLDRKAERGQDARGKRSHPILVGQAYHRVQQRGRVGLVGIIGIVIDHRTVRPRIEVGILLQDRQHVAIPGHRLGDGGLAEQQHADEKAGVERRTGVRCAHHRQIDLVDLAVEILARPARIAAGDREAGPAIGAGRSVEFEFQGRGWRGDGESAADVVRAEMVATIVWPANGWPNCVTMIGNPGFRRDLSGTRTCRRAHRCRRALPPTTRSSRRRHPTARRRAAAFAAPGAAARSDCRWEETPGFPLSARNSRARRSQPAIPDPRHRPPPDARRRS